MARLKFVYLLILAAFAVGAALYGRPSPLIYVGLLFAAAAILLMKDPRA